MRLDVIDVVEDGVVNLHGTRSVIRIQTVRDTNQTILAVTLKFLMAATRIAMGHLHVGDELVRGLSLHVAVSRPHCAFRLVHRRA